MAATIEVNKQSVKQLLESGKSKKFLIPEYQRPYAWTDEQIQILFDDIVEYTAENKEDTYFLGAIVSYENENQQEIIDGQQRITSLFLLLRALYEKLGIMTETDETKYLQSQIEPALWEQNELTGKVSYEKTLISSKVMGDDGNKRFLEILVTGKADKEAIDNYSRNYIYFQNLIEQYASEEPMLFYRFISNVLNKAILLPITANGQDTALTIFSTLNDRGLALSDSDIFKAKLYNKLEKEEKTDFIKCWQQLDEDALNAGESIQKLFYYYMFYLRALEDDRKTTTPGIRKYYSKNHYEKLYGSSVMEDLSTILNLWLVVNNRETLQGEGWSENQRIKQLLDILLSYPNEFWKYPVVIFYLKYHEESEFETNFLKFLQKLTATLAARYITTPTINAVKRGILNLNADIIKSSSPEFDFNEVDIEQFCKEVKIAHRNIVRMLLKIIAYQKQEELLPYKWEIEHILPQRWKDSYFPKNDEEEVKELVEHIGNKIPFEKRLNIIASNGYFLRKQEQYLKSSIELVKEMTHIKTDDWTIDHIRERDIRLSDELKHLFLSWGLNQSKVGSKLIEIPPERLNDYKEFTKLFGKEDNNVTRQTFLDISLEDRSNRLNHK